MALACGSTHWHTPCNACARSFPSSSAPVQVCKARAPAVLALCDAGPADAAFVEKRIDRCSDAVHVHGVGLVTEGAPLGRLVNQAGLTHKAARRAHHVARGLLRHPAVGAAVWAVCACEQTTRRHAHGGGKERSRHGAGHLCVRHTHARAHAATLLGQTLSPRGEGRAACAGRGVPSGTLGGDRVPHSRCEGRERAPLPWERGTCPPFACRRPLRGAGRAARRAARRGAARRTLVHDCAQRACRRRGKRRRETAREAGALSGAFAHDRRAVVAEL